MYALSPSCGRPIRIGSIQIARSNRSLALSLVLRLGLPRKFARSQRPAPKRPVGTLPGQAQRWTAPAARGRQRHGSRRRVLDRTSPRTALFAIPRGCTPPRRTACPSRTRPGRRKHVNTSPHAGNAISARTPTGMTTSDLDIAHISLTGQQTCAPRGGQDVAGCITTRN